MVVDVNCLFFQAQITERISFMFTIAGYEVDHKLYESASSITYRAKLNGQRVILKMLKELYPEPERIAWFKQEYEVTRKLRLSGVAAAYALENDQHRWVMVLEDFGGESLAHLGGLPSAAEGDAMADFLHFAIRVTEILGEIHQQHIIHKDINPSNIVINPETGQVKLIDFGISTVLSRENQTFQIPNVLEGTLAYISPEQTGRMNRAIDYRSDFYSLGVTFYELLTGEWPFKSDDALELVHSHIAKQPLSPHGMKPEIPMAISEIVLKLMAKNAEARYQSAHGLKADLERCWQEWHATGQIQPFRLGKKDISDRFQLPLKLYGRHEEIRRLLNAFERVAQGASEMMLVTGYSGIGKSALVQEVYKPITSQRGYFISGKFDQFQRNVPYFGLIQAFRALLRHLLSESEAQIAAWREKLLAVFGPNGQIMIDVIPEIELIVGPQPAVPELGPAEAQNRFNLLFQRFLQLFTQAEHPLVIFLDDLQWADGASLKLLELLLTTTVGFNLFVIGAYRDNEVHETDPLMLMLNEMRKSERTLNQIALSPLTSPQISYFIADTLTSTPEEVASLAELVLAKTGGNPFFLSEFLKSLYAQGLIHFDHEAAQWQWQLEEIQERSMTDNVVELMASNVEKLPDSTQQLLKLAACIGNTFDLHTLAVVAEQSPAETARKLWTAVTEGLLVPLSEHCKLMGLDVAGLSLSAEYKFAHDRVQQAVYLLIPEQEKEAVHWRVGQLLLANTPPEAREERIFEIVNQLNKGPTFITDHAQRDEVAQLNLLAGQKAKAAMAYQPALSYFRVALALLDDNCWQNNYNPTLQLFVAAVEAEYLNSHLERASALSEEVIQHAKTLLEKVKVYELQIQFYVAQNQMSAAIETSLHVLQMLGVSLPTQAEAIGAYAEGIRQELTAQISDIAALADLPFMNDPYQLAAMRILMTAIVPVYHSNPALFAPIIFTMTKLCVQGGNSPLAAYAYGMYGLFLCGGYMEIDDGYEFGLLSLRMIEQFNAPELHSKVYHLFNVCVRHCKEPARDAVKPLQEHVQSGIETGDLEYAGFNALHYGIHLFLVGEPLSLVNQQQAHYLTMLNKFELAFHHSFSSIWRQVVHNLLGEAEEATKLIGECLDEREMLPIWQEKSNVSLLFSTYCGKTILLYLLNEYDQALDAARLAEPYAQAATGLLYAYVYNFYHSLVLLAHYANVNSEEQAKLLEKVAAQQEKMKFWASHAPANFQHKYDLVEAEKARVLGQTLEAMSLYDRAIQGARKEQYIQEEALAYERAAEFYLALGREEIAEGYMRKAHYGYLRWGAVAKVKQLEARYPSFVAQSRHSQSISSTINFHGTNTGSQSATVLDLGSVLKASQAISGEIVLDTLLTKMMTIIIENAGAERGYLLLKKKGEWVIEAESATEQQAVMVLQSRPISEHLLPMSMINFVTHTQEVLVLDDAANEGAFRQDYYINSQQPKSVLCAPLLNQGQLIGLLYLENNLTTAAFTQDRLEMLKLLSSQAAISLENAQLYNNISALNSAYERFVPRQFLSFLEKESIIDVQLGDQVEKEMTVLFSDIRDFTSLSEKMTPAQNFRFVNGYLSRMEPIITKHHGFIDKYIGDAIMALFPTNADDAVRASIAMLRRLNHYNITRTRPDRQPIQIGIGLHTGRLMLGTVGGHSRMDGTVISDAVNLGARVEGLTKRYGATLLITEHTHAQLQDTTDYTMREIDRVAVKGKTEPVTLFDLFDGDVAKQIMLKKQTLTDFALALSLYRQQKFASAIDIFSDILRHNPQDQAARLYIARCRELQQRILPADWDGVFIATTK